MRRTTWGLAALALVGVMATGCSNPACESNAKRKLQGICLLSPSPAIGATCLGLPETPAEEAERNAALDDHWVSSCNIADPSLDIDCVETQPCEDIAAGMCDLETPNEMVRLCTRECSSQASECVLSCANEASFGACLDCELRCEENRGDCNSACDG